MRHNIKTVGLPPRKAASFLQSIKDDLNLKTPGIYSISCECGMVYIGQTEHSIEIRIKEQYQHIRLCHPDKSTMVKCGINLSHHIQFQDTSILAMKSKCMEWIIREVIEIELHCVNMNREEGFSLSKSWSLFCKSWKDERRPLLKKSDLLFLNDNPRIRPFQEPSTLYP